MNFDISFSFLRTCRTLICISYQFLALDFFIDKESFFMAAIIVDYDCYHQRLLKEKLNLGKVEKKEKLAEKLFNKNMSRLFFKRWILRLVCMSCDLNIYRERNFQRKTWLYILMYRCKKENYRKIKFSI